MTSRCPPESEATTGVPHNIASTRVAPEGFIDCRCDEDVAGSYPRFDGVTRPHEAANVIEAAPRDLVCDPLSTFTAAVAEHRIKNRLGSLRAHGSGNINKCRRALLGREFSDVSNGRGIWLRSRLGNERRTAFYTVRRRFGRSDRVGDEARF